MQELLGIQEEYKQLLEELYNEKDKDEFIYIIDEINLFWYSKQNIVELIMERISENFDTYLFTGATYLDVEEGEHYPFVSLGKVHIVDDPLAKYAEAINLNLNSSFYKMMKEQIILAFDDDLRILQECFGNIFLIPVTLLNKLEDGFVKHASEKALLSIFKEDLSIKDILAVESFPELILMMQDGIQEYIVFLEGEDREEDILVRFETYLHEINDPFGNISITHKFIYSILSFISQSFHILLCAVQYKIIPYIRYDITFNYLSIIGKNFLDVTYVQEIMFKMTFTYFFYKKFNWELIKSIDYERYYDTVTQIDIMAQVEKQMKNEYKLDTTSIKDINCMIDDFLEKIKTKN